MGLSRPSGGGEPREVLLPLEPGFDPGRHALLAPDHRWRCGQRIEIHPSWEAWLQEWVPGWKQGALLVVDYGGPARPTPRRALGGTLRGYFRHLRVDGAECYRRVGRQDLTADVCFSDLESMGARAGLATVGRVRRLDAWMADWDPSHETDTMSQQGAATEFHVLEQKPRG